MRVPPPGALGQGRRPHVGELFTDRLSESEAFAVALARFRHRLSSDVEVRVARHNVLTFYGLGGIGKSALSQRLEDWVRDKLPPDTGWGPVPATRVHATARVDLHGSRGQVDVAATLIALRSGCAGLSKRWPVFDLAFTAYWSAVRPGEPLPAFDGRDELEATVADTVKDALGDVASLADVATGVPAGLAVKGVRKLVDVLRRRRDLRLAVEAFPGFEEFLLRCADEPGPADHRPSLACEIAGALSWEIAGLESCPLVVVFVDTTERLKLDDRRTAESHLNRLVHQMPNVLFVLTGRDSIDWYREARADLPFHGRWTWPGLVPGATAEPRQHLVGRLSANDTRELVLRGRTLLGLPMSDGVVDQLVVASGGLPEYLELARQVALSIKDSGGSATVTVDDVTGSLGSLVMRLLDDIPDDEQRAVRAACLFRIFDVGLIAAAADVDYGCAERAVSRPMIDRFPDERFPYRMHDSVRDAIRRADPGTVRGGWAEPDWQRAGTRAARAARDIYVDARDREDSRETLEAVGIAIGLVCDQEIVLDSVPGTAYEDWLSQAIVFAPGFQGLRSRVPARSRTEYGRHVLDFIRAKTVDTPIEERIDLLRGIFRSEHPLRLPAGRHLGYTLKTQNRWDDALAAFDDLIAVSPTQLNRNQRPQVLSMARRFQEAWEATDNPKGAGYIARVGEYAHGRPERYFDTIGTKMTRLRSAGQRREYLEEVGDHLVRRVLFRGDVTRDEIDRYQAEAELAGHAVGVRSALLATILLRGGDPTDVSVALERLLMQDRAASATSNIGFRYAMAEFCDAVISRSIARLDTLRDDAARCPFRSRAWIPVECFLSLVDRPLPPVPTQWLEPVAEVERRWGVHLDAYLARHNANLSETS